jgi:hypothetical protein
MYSYYSYDAQLDLYALMIVDGDGEELSVVLDTEEFEHLLEWSATTSWRAEPLGLEAATIRALLYEIIQRDPYDG